MVWQNGSNNEGEGGDRGVHLSPLNLTQRSFEKKNNAVRQNHAHTPYCVVEDRLYNFPMDILRIMLSYALVSLDAFMRAPFVE